MTIKKEADLARCHEEAAAFAAGLTERDLDLFSLGLYAGEGAKTGGVVSMANTNPTLLLVFVTWLRRRIGVEEGRLRAFVYLHEGLDLEAAVSFWSELLDIPAEQFTAPYRAVADPSIRSAKHVNGCATVRYCSATASRRVMAMIEAVASHFANPG